HPAIRHGNITPPTTLQYPPDFAQMRLLIRPLANVLNDVVADDHIKFGIRKREDGSLYQLEAVALLHHTFVAHVDRVNPEAPPPDTIQIVGDTSGTRANLQYSQVIPGRFQREDPGDLQRLEMSGFQIKRSVRLS